MRDPPPGGTRPVRHDVRRSVVQSVRPPAEAFVEIEEITAWAAHRIRVVLLAKGWLFLLSGSRGQLRVNLCSPWYPAPAQSEMARLIPMRRAGHRRPGLHPPRGPGRRPTTRPKGAR